MHSFFTELGRRNVFRVAGLYAVVGWLLVQVAGAMESALTMPGWFDTVIFSALLLGFPIALILAWAFEMTPDGVKPTSTAQSDGDAPPKVTRGLDVAILGCLLAVGGLVAWQTIGSTDTTRPSNQVATEAATTDSSIAVLPFVDMSPEGDQEYFSDGISEELLNVLAQVEALKVAGRTSAFSFKNKDQDLRKIGEILAVDHILEGSVRKSGDKIRVTAQLIRAADGFHLWSKSFDRDLNDIFAVQDEIAQAILAELTPQLLGEDVVEEVKVARTNLDAYDLYLLARNYMSSWNADALERASAALDEALEIDPDYAPALAWRGYTEMMSSDAFGAWGLKPQELALPRAKALIEQAIAEDPLSADALFGMAGLYGFVGDVVRAEQYYRLALAEKPSFPMAQNDYAFTLIALGRYDEAQELLEAALARDPALIDANMNLLATFQHTGRTEKAQKVLDRWRSISPESGPALYASAEQERLNGNLAAAYRINQEGLKSPSLFGRAPYYVARSDLSLLNLEPVLSSDNVQATEFKALAMLAAGRGADALAFSRESLAKRPDDPRTASFHMTILYNLQRWDEIVEHFDKTYEDIKSFHESNTFPKYAPVAAAFVALDHPLKDEFVEAAVEYHNSLLYEGSPLYHAHEDYTTVHAVIGNDDVAFKALEEILDRGLLSATTGQNPAFHQLKDKDRFNTLLDRAEEKINSERAALGFEPVEIPRQPVDPTGGS